MRQNPATITSIQSFFTWDHERLDRELAALVKLIDAGQISRAVRALAHLERGLRRHMSLEEELVLQMFAHERTGAARSPREIQADHGEISLALAAMGHALAADDVEAARAPLARLLAILPAHHAEEEQVIYPLLDSLVGAAEAERIVGQLRGD